MVDNPQVRSFKSDEDLRYFAAVNSDMDFLIGLEMRPGVMLCASAIEYLVYRPGTENNANFEVIMYKWFDLLIIIIGVQRRHRLRWRPIVKACMLTPVKGILGTYEDGKLVHFPLNTPNCRALEFMPKHPVYGNPPLVNKLKDHEKQLCLRIFNGWKPTPDQLHAEWIKGMSNET
jgi:hypothetical protein